MARYRLTAEHYLHSPGSEWEQRETDRDTGKQVRKVYPTPRFLNPNDPADHNYPGEIIITTSPSPEHRRDIHVTGPRGGPFIPTPDMEPIDAEAEAIVARLRPQWDRAFIDDGGGNYSQALISQFEQMMTETMRKAITASPAPDPTVAELRQQLDAQAIKIAELTALQGEAPKPAVARRI